MTTSESPYTGVMRHVERSPVQFAVVREDPRIEKAVIEELRPRRALVTASGGCTALALAAWFPDLEITLVDPNAAQLRHVEDKRRILLAGDRAPFGVGSSDPALLHELGNFERLFRQFRGFLDLFVIDAVERERRLRAGETFEDVFVQPYWSVAFELIFSDAMLTTMFGPDAVRHAAKGSYPGYFRSRIEGGLRAEDRCVNPWLHHLLLGRYAEHPAAWPPFLRERAVRTTPFAEIHGTFADVPSFAAFDLVQLSNVPDWMSDDDCAGLARRLGAEMSAGGVVFWRQLNDPRDLVAMFAEFVCDPARDTRLCLAERSLFYDQVHVGVRR